VLTTAEKILSEDKTAGINMDKTVPNFKLVGRMMVVTF
jgi:hypothetical protein